MTRKANNTDLERIKKVVIRIWEESTGVDAPFEVITEFIDDLTRSNYGLPRAKQLKKWEQKYGLR